MLKAISNKNVTRQQYVKTLGALIGVMRNYETVTRESTK